MYLLLHNVLLVTLLTNPDPILLWIKISLNLTLSSVFKLSSFSRISLSCFFDIFHGNITNIESFLVVFINNCLPLFVYHVLIRIAVFTEVQDTLHQSMVLCWLFITLVTQFFLSVISCRKFSY